MRRFDGLGLHGAARWRHIEVRREIGAAGEDAFASKAGAWYVNAPLRYRAQPMAGNDAVSLLQLAEALPAEVRAEVTIRGKDGGSGFLKNGMFIFDYQGPADFKFAGGFFGANRGG